MLNYTVNLNAEETDSLKNIQISEIEPLYWKMEDLLFDGKKESAENIFNLLVYLAQNHPKIIRSALRPKYMTRLKQAVNEFYGDSIPVHKQQIEMKEPLPKQILPFKKEGELRDFLSNNLDLLRAILNKNIQLQGTEVTTYGDFKCDIVVADNTTLFPIELKIVQANHSVVSQIDKYCFYYYRKLRYGQFKEVQGIVISNGFCPWSINELRKNGHKIFYVENDTKSTIKLVPV